MVPGRGSRELPPPPQAQQDLSPGRRRDAPPTAPGEGQTAPGSGARPPTPRPRAPGPPPGSLRPPRRPPVREAPSTGARAGGAGSAQAGGLDTEGSPPILQMGEAEDQGHDFNYLDVAQLGGRYAGTGTQV